MTANQISYWNLLETSRANREREKENYRTNTANESIKQQDANTRSSAQQETARSNVVNEGIKQQQANTAERQMEGQLERWRNQNRTDSVNAGANVLKSIIGGASLL